MSTPNTGRARVVTVVLLVAAVIGAGLLLFPRGDGGKPALALVATFRDASPLLPGNDVRSHGVKVGTITSITLEDGLARVGVELEPSALPVHQDARLTIKPVSLLGERFLDLDSGSADAPVMADGGTIDADHTGSNVGLDEVLDTLDAPTSASLGLLVQALGVGMDGNGKQVQDAIAALRPALTDTSELTRVLRDQNRTLGQLVSSMEPVAGGLATDQGAALDRLVDATHDTLAATAADDQAFRAMLAELPQTLRQARRTMDRLYGAARTVTPTLAHLRPTTSQLEGISKELNAFGSAADPALRSAEPVLDRAEKLLQAARPVAAALRRGSPAARTVATDAVPVTSKVAANFTPVMEFFKGWALTTNGKDGLSHYFRAGLVLSPRDSTGLPVTAPLGGSAPATTGGNLLEGLDGLTGGLNLPGLGDTSTLLGNLSGGLLRQQSDAGGGVTGMSARQESDALSYLLGGE